MTEAITFRCYPGERRVFVRNARALGKTMSDLVRQVMLDYSGMMNDLPKQDGLAKTVTE